MITKYFFNFVFSRYIGMTWCLCGKTHFRFLGINYHYYALIKTLTLKTYKYL